MTKPNPRLVTCGVDGCANLVRKVGRSRYCSDDCSRLARNALLAAKRTPETRAANFARWYAKHGQRYRDENVDRIRENHRRFRDANPGYRDAWVEANQERVTAIFRKSHWKARYNLTVEEVHALLESQDFCCANKACAASLVGDDARRMHIDHDHACCSGQKSCGKCIRGLLCHNCNVSAGLLGDDPETIRGLATYLEVKPC